MNPYGPPQAPEEDPPKKPKKDFSKFTSRQVTNLLREVNRKITTLNNKHREVVEELETAYQGKRGVIGREISDAVRPIRKEFDEGMRSIKQRRASKVATATAEYEEGLRTLREAKSSQLEVLEEGVVVEREVLDEEYAKYLQELTDGFNFELAELILEQKALRERLPA